MRLVLALLLLTVFLGSAMADEPGIPALPPAPPPPGRVEPPPPLGGPPPALQPHWEDAGTPPTPRVPGGKRVARVEAFGWADWQLWWELNLGPYEELKRRIYGSQMSALGQPLFPSAPKHHLLGHWTRKRVAADVLPALVRLLEPKGTPRVHSSVRLDALLSLGKLAREEQHVDLLLRWTYEPGKPGVHGGARALLSLGLLRRAHAADQFSSALLDKVRAVLLRRLETSGTPGRLQRASAIALGLLGDQPTVGGADGHRRHATRLFERLECSIDDATVAPTVLIAIGHQLPASVSAVQRELLRTLAWKRGLGSPRAAREVVAWAAWALGRVGTAEDLSTLRRIIQRPRLSERTQRWCAALALGALGCRLSGEGREEAARALRACFPDERDAALRGYVLIGLGQTLAGAVESDEPDAYESWMASAPLFDALRRDAGASRGYAALGLGILARAIGEHPPPGRAAELRTKALRALGRALADERHPRTQAAAAIALGMARAGTARDALLTLLTDETVDPRIPPAAAWALGLLAYPTKDTAARLGESARTLMYGSLRQRSIRALALLGHPRIPGDGDAVALLLGDLRTSKTMEERWEAITLLGRVGDERAIDPLLEILASEERTGWEQGAAVLALGCIGDLEEETALDRLRRGVHYRSYAPYEAIRWP